METLTESICLSFVVVDMSNLDTNLACQQCYCEQYLEKAVESPSVPARSSQEQNSRQRKQRQVSWEEYKDMSQLCRDGVKKAKAQLELNLARDAKNNKKGIYRYVSQKRKVKESVPTLMNMTSKLVTTDEEKAEVLNNFFASVFTGNVSFHSS
ncbi:hypothetical protein llap_17920 [Limosa lapponica baueri]|uniref:Rna-directed dna polymerase from mobile element jockey-like n=1 Tax=Limosa lapponica baueri TaxID=1758121 RepID=A0A2I0TDA8_LIMLA|nr:hypothetical protein llap_17920 [Limosa lapponica baueri]